MAFTFSIVTLLSCFFIIPSTVAWGPLKGTLKGGYGLHSKATGRDYFEEDNKSVLKSSYRTPFVERAANPYTLQFQGEQGVYFEELQDAKTERLKIKDPLGLGPPSFFEVVEFDIDYCQGADCEEDCPIPEEFKIPNEDVVDIMAFLGINRAAPLQANKHKERK